MRLDSELTPSIDIRPPNSTQAVYREDCTQCFDSVVSIVRKENANQDLTIPGRSFRLKRLSSLLQWGLHRRKEARASAPRSYRAPSCLEYQENSKEDSGPSQPRQLIRVDVDDYSAMNHLRRCLNLRSRQKLRKIAMIR